MAAVLSFFFPGVGHMYAGHIFQGLMFLILVPVAYVIALFTLGLGLLFAIPLHIWVMIDSQRAVERRKKRDMIELAKAIRGK